MDKKTAVQELMELDTFLKIMGVTIEWDKYLEKEKEQMLNQWQKGFEDAKYIYNQTK
tara:strand:- start:1538 stop:1708 length:171 start_codon:yes stop_codon:yes gene_type:complete